MVEEENWGLKMAYVTGIKRNKKKQVTHYETDEYGIVSRKRGVELASKGKLDNVVVVETSTTSQAKHYHRGQYRMMNKNLERIILSTFTLVNLVPLFVALGITIFFIEASEHLGHYPRPSIDDPKNLPIWAKYSYLADWLVASYLILIGGLVVIGPLRTRLNLVNRNFAAALLTFNWIAYISLHAVPGINVLEWYLD